MFRKIFKNLAWLSLGEIVYNGLIALLVIILARYLGAEEYGKFSFALSFTALFIILADLGISPLTVRELSKKKELAKTYLSHILPLKLILSLLTLLVIFIFTKIIKKGEEINLLIYLASLYIIFLSFNQFFTAVCRSFQKMNYEALGKIVQGILVFILSILGIIFHSKTYFFLFAYLLAAFLATIFIAILVKKNISDFSLKLNFLWQKKILQKSLPFALTIVFISIYYHIDSVMLGLLKNNQQVGWYTAAYKIIFLFIALKELVCRNLYPNLSQYFHQNLKNNLKLVISKFEKLGIFFAFPLSLGTTILAPKIINFLYGKEYLINSTIALRILIWAIAIIYLNLLFPTFLLASNNEKKYMRIVIVGATMNVILNIILIPSYQLAGAAVATVLTELFIFINAYSFSQKIIKINIFKYLPKVLLASTIMTISLIILYPLNLFLLLLLGTSIYLLFIYLLGYFSQEEIKSIKNIFKNAA